MSSDNPPTNPSVPANNDHPNATLPTKGRLGGIDFGTVRIGIAISDPGQSIASPLTTYQRRTPELDAKYFDKIAKEERLAGWVVGLPVHMSGDASEKSREAIAFGTWLEEQTGVTVAWIDERFTTAMAREILSQSNLSGKKRKAQLDKLAAQILLTAFLERQSNSEPSTTPTSLFDE